VNVACLGTSVGLCRSQLLHRPLASRLHLMGAMGITSGSNGEEVIWNREEVNSGQVPSILCIKYLYFARPATLQSVAEYQSVTTFSKVYKFDAVQRGFGKLCDVSRLTSFSWARISASFSFSLATASSICCSVAARREASSVSSSARLAASNSSACRHAWVSCVTRDENPVQHTERWPSLGQVCMPRYQPNTTNPGVTNSCRLRAG